MHVTTLWLIYIVFVFVIWFVFWHPGFEPCVSPLSALFYALLLGFLFVYLLSPTVDIDILSNLERAWYQALLGLAFILPLIILGLAIIYIYEHLHKILIC